MLLSKLIIWLWVFLVGSKQGVGIYAVGLVLRTSVFKDKHDHLSSEVVGGDPISVCVYDLCQDSVATSDKLKLPEV